MKAALMQANKIMTIVSIIFIILTVVGILSAYVALGFTLGYITARLVMKKFIGQLDNLAPLELPSSNFVFNMLIYSVLFVGMGRLNVEALLSSAAGLIVYRKMFFIFVQKRLKEGG